MQIAFLAIQKQIYSYTDEGDGLRVRSIGRTSTSKVPTATDLPWMVTHSEAGETGRLGEDGKGQKVQGKVQRYVHSQTTAAIHTVLLHRHVQCSVLRAWHGFVPLAKEEREREKRRDELRRKVASWLKDYHPSSHTIK